jgi:transposase
MTTIKHIGLDVHKNSISISTADEGRDAEVRYYGKIGNDMTQLMKVFVNLFPKDLN